MNLSLLSLNDINVSRLLLKPNNTIRDAHAIFQPTLTPKNGRRFARRHRTVSKNSIGNSPHSSKGSVTTLQFQDDNTLISASDLDGIIKVSNTNTLSMVRYLT